MKEKKDLRIVFMGTPPFAVAQLDALLNAGYHIAAVVTATDKPAGRGKKLTPSAVKEYAQAHDLPLLQPEKLRDETFLQQLKALEADLFVVVAFRMLPREVWSLPPLGTFNLHASLLPDYRGAAPINWAVINGETRTGLTTFLLDENIDTGAILLQRSLDIAPQDDFGSLYQRLAEMGRELVVETVEQLRQGTATPQAQPAQASSKPAPKIFKPDTLIRWTRSARQVVDLVRGLSPAPGAYTLLWTKGEPLTLKVYKAAVTDIPTEGYYGQVHIEGKRLLAGCADRFIALEEVQPEGKKRMAVADFLNGFRPGGDERFL